MGEILQFPNTRIHQGEQALESLGASSKVLFEILISFLFAKKIPRERGTEQRRLMTQLKGEEGLTNGHYRLTIRGSQWNREGYFYIQFNGHEIQYRWRGPADILFDQKTKVVINPINGASAEVEALNGMKFVAVTSETVLLRDPTAEARWEHEYQNWERQRRECEDWEREHKGFQYELKARLSNIIPRIFWTPHSISPPLRPAPYPPPMPEDHTMPHAEFLTIIAVITEALEEAAFILGHPGGPDVA